MDIIFLANTEHISYLVNTVKKYIYQYLKSELGINHNTSAMFDIFIPFESSSRAGSTTIRRKGEWRWDDTKITFHVFQARGWAAHTCDSRKRHIRYGAIAWSTDVTGPRLLLKLPLKCFVDGTYSSFNRIRCFLYNGAKLVHSSPVQSCNPKTYRQAHDRVAPCIWWSLAWRFNNFDGLWNQPWFNCRGGVSCTAVNMSQVHLHQGYMQTSLSPDKTLTSVILKMTAKHTWDWEGFVHHGPYSWRRLATKVVRVVGRCENDEWLGPDGICAEQTTGEWTVFYHGTVVLRANPILKGKFKPVPRALYGDGI